MNNLYTNTKHTTIAGLARARRTYRHGWDTRGVTVAYRPPPWSRRR